MGQAWKVGALVVVFGGLLFAAYGLVGQKLFAPKPMRIKALFSDAGGLTPGAKALMAGVKIGQVESVTLESPTQAAVWIAFDQGVKIPKGATATLASSLIGFGDNPVQIVPPAKPTESLLVENDVILGKRQGPLEGIAPDLAPNLNATLTELNKTLASARGLVEDRELRNQLVTVLNKTSRTLDNFGALAGSASAALNENRKSIHGALNTFAVAMQDVEKSARLAAQLLADPRYKDQAAEILKTLGSTAKRADSLMANVESIVADPSLKSSINKTMTDMNSITDSGTRIAANTEKMTANGVTASENVAELTKKVNALADDAKTVLEKIQKFFERPSGVPPLQKLETRADIMREDDPEPVRVDFNLRYPIAGGSVHAGIYDAFEQNKLNLQLGKEFGQAGEYRYGMYAGQPGLGVDYRVAPKVSLRGDLFGLNRPRLDIRTEFGLRKDLLGWIGVHRIGDKSSFAAGIAIKK